MDERREVGAAIVIGGRVRAIWGVRTEEGTASFRVEPVDRISEHYRRTIAARMEDIVGFLGCGYGERDSSRMRSEDPVPVMRP